MMRRPALLRAFDGWIESLDQELAHELSSLRSWIGTSLFVLSLLPLLAFTPGLRDYFALELGPPLFLFAPLGVCGIGFSLWHRGDKGFGRGAWMFFLVGSIYLQFFCASLVAFTGARASATIASLFLLAAGYHGHTLRVTPRVPFLAVGTALAAMGAAALNPTPDRVAVLSLMGVAAVAGELITGTIAARWAQARRRADQLQAAVQAQLLDEQERELSRLSDTLVEVLGRTHDLNNALMAVNLHADLMILRCEGSTDAELASLSERMQAALEQLNALMGELMAPGQKLSAPDAEGVELWPLLDAVRRQVGARFPSVRLALSQPPERPLRVLVRGGALTLKRVVENLLINACEGDGRRGAAAVELRALRDESGACAVVSVIDDGPGFQPGQLAQGVEAFATSKAQGTGLGLYTSERLVRASGGALERANRDGGGARVAVRLPLASG